MIREISPEKRARFLQSALKLFVSNGVQNTTTAAIAREAGTAAGTLFLYFPTKQDLLNELVLQIAREQSEHVQRLLQPSLSAKETFFAIWQGTLHWFLQNTPAYLYIQQVRDTGMISESAVLESNQLFSYYYDAIQKGIQEGAIKTDLVGLIGAFLYQDIVGVMNYLRTQPDTSHHEEILQQGFIMFWDGIKSNPSHSPDR